MISKDCKYKYINKKCDTCVYTHHVIEHKEAIKILDSCRIYEIIGYTDVIEFITVPAKYENTYLCPYSIQLLRYLWDAGDEQKNGPRDIINIYLGVKCKSKTEMENYYVAKVLGSKND